MTGPRPPSSSKKKAPPAKTAPAAKGAKGEAAARRVGGFLLGQVAQSAAAPVVNLFAAGLLGFACVFLVAAWQVAPERLVTAQHYKKLTQATQGRIVDSWLALELNPAAVGSHSSWEPFSKASGCVIVAYQGESGARYRRAFCGSRFAFGELQVPPDLRDMAPQVPFAWRRDASGFSSPEIRLSPAARQWLGSHPAGFVWPNKPPPPLALVALRQALDRPVDSVVVGWSLPVPPFPLLLDPRHPDDALPTGYVLRQRDAYPAAGNWIGCVILGLLGLVVWYEALGLLWGNKQRWLFWIVAVAGLATLPWWSEQAPRALRYLNKNWGDVIELMLNDLGTPGWLLACDPADATLARGEKLVWRAGEGTHADTFWRLALKPGLAPPAFAATVETPTGNDPALNARSDAALAALTDHITQQMRTLDAEERTTLFRQLERDKQNAVLHAGLVFIPAAKEALLDPQSPPALRRAVRDFLWAWVLTPDDGMSSHLARDERLRIERQLLDVPIPEIANMATLYWGPRSRTH